MPKTFENTIAPLIEDLRDKFTSATYQPVTVAYAQFGTSAKSLYTEEESRDALLDELAKKFNEVDPELRSLLEKYIRG